MAEKKTHFKLPWGPFYFHVTDNKVGPTNVGSIWIDVGSNLHFADKNNGYHHGPWPVTIALDGTISSTSLALTIVEENGADLLYSIGMTGKISTNTGGTFSPFWST